MRHGTTAAVLATVLAACASRGSRDAVQATPGASTQRQEAELAAAIAKARADSTRLPYTEADIHFMSGMIHHHAQAIAMAKLAPTRAGSEALRTLAARVINAQTDEIAFMQQWLRERRLPVPEPSPTGMKMKMGGMEHEMLMPGMLTPEQMKELENAKGNDFDGLFLTYMIQHHEGATAMVKELFSNPGAGQDETVWKLAADINIDQETEIERMQKMLYALATKGQIK